MGVYESMLFMHRARLHQIIALWYMQSFENKLISFLGIIAWHVEKSGHKNLAVDLYEQSAFYNQANMQFDTAIINFHHCLRLMEKQPASNRDTQQRIQWWNVSISLC